MYDIFEITVYCCLFIILLMVVTICLPKMVVTEGMSNPLGKITKALSQIPKATKTIEKTYTKSVKAVENDIIDPIAHFGKLLKCIGDKFANFFTKNCWFYYILYLIYYAIVGIFMLLIEFIEWFFALIIGKEAVNAVSQPITEMFTVMYEIADDIYLANTGSHLGFPKSIINNCFKC